MHVPDVRDPSPLLVSNLSFSVQERLREEARRQFEEDDRQMKEKMNEELEELRKALEEKTKMLASTNNAARVYWLRRKSQFLKLSEEERAAGDCRDL